MSPRSSHSPARATRPAVAPIHRGPQAETAGHPHAPNAALLIDFDNVTMGIRSDLQTELRNLLSSAIISGKVAVQRAYADWRRYPQYIVPLSESSIDLIFAPAYGSAKKNATDIRLAVDAIELVFTRPEIGTFILLSGDSDFSSLVLKLKEYGKYVIGVGIRESSSDLLVQNCDEYYSYNALAGLMKAGDEQPAKKWDPWELVTEAIGRMQRNGDVMRSDRLKQVMVEIDPSFDEKDLGMSKFSRFCLEAASKGRLQVTKLENGQLEVGPVQGGAPAPAATNSTGERPPRAEGERDGRGRRGRRGRGGRGRGGDREERTGGEGAESSTATSVATMAEPAARGSSRPPRGGAPKVDASIGSEGIRLTRDEAFDIVRQAINAVGSEDSPVGAERVRAKARELLGRDSESLAPRFFERILKDAHDAGIVDLRKRGDSFEVMIGSGAPSIADQLAVAEAAATPKPVASAPVPRGMGVRSAPGRGGRPGAKPAMPANLLVGLVEEPVIEAPRAATEKVPAKAAAKKSAAKKPPAKKAAAKKAPAKKAAKKP
ncbi:MAG: NYN domain-containing protein [Gemmatimonadetes bacterium]|nr:NYN domain-containing protein [Gemmatimonadota bacterium]